MGVTTPLAENYIYHHEGQVQGVTVGVHINYAEGYISLIDVNKQNPAAAQNCAKSYVFKRRGLEYMRGWQDICDGIKAAISDATAKLEAYTEKVAKEKEELLVAAMSEQNG